MPIQSCTLPSGSPGYRWGGSGKCYADRADAERQAAAAYANGYAGDRAIAFDRATMRRIDVDGRLHVELTNISKATVNPYYGREIPDYERLGLDADRIYQMLRHPDELRKSAPSFNNIPLLRRHVPISADEYDPEDVVGSTGTDAVFNEPYLQNSLVVWDAGAIAAVETGDQQQLSCAYRYVAEMVPGSYQGLTFDGIMRNIVANHVALVEVGRAGPDVMVADSKLGISMALKSKKALMVKGALTAAMRPLLAADAKLDMAAILAGVNAANFKTSKPTILKRLEVAAKGKLIAADADLAPVKLALDAMEEEEEAEDEMETEAEKKAEDEGEEGEPKRAEDEGEEGEPKKAEDEGEEGEPKKEASADKKAKDRRAMDAAISKAVAKATADTLARVNAVRSAEREVRPYVGEVSAMDSADDIYKFALDQLGVDLTGIPPVAYPAILRMQPKPGSSPTRRTLGMDADAGAGILKRFPEAARLGQA